MLLDLGSWGYQIGAIGIWIFTVSYLVAVRWWTDWLGRTIAGVLFTISGILLVTTLRQLFPHWVGMDYRIWRLIAFWAFAIAVWSGWAAFLSAQFFARRIKKGKKDEETRLAAYRNHRDGDLHDRAGGHDR